MLERVLVQNRNLMLWLLLLALTARIETWRRQAKAQRTRKIPRPEVVEEEPAPAAVA